MELTFLIQMSTLSRNLNHQFKCSEKKESSYILEVYNALVQAQFAISKTILDILKKNFSCKLPEELPNDFRLKILGNFKML